MSARVNYIINRLHRAEQNGGGEKPSDPVIAGVHPFWRNKRVRSFTKQARVYIGKWWVVALFIGLAAITIYYYNRIMMAWQDAGAALATVKAHEQRRNDLSVNLGNAVSVYARHEHDLFSYTAELRAKSLGGAAAMMGKPTAGESSGKPGGLLGGIFGIAEQYPDLKLSGEFDHIIGAVFQVESDLALARTNYNAAANRLSTALGTFPGNFYGWLFGFKAFPLFDSTHDSKQFIPMRLEEEGGAQQAPKKDAERSAPVGG